MFFIPDGGGGGPLLLDNFVDADGTPTTAHTPDIGPGGPWNLGVGTAPQIWSNKATFNASGVAGDVSIDLGRSGSFVIKCGFQFVSLGGNYFFVWADGNTNGFVCMSATVQGGSGISIQLADGVISQTAVVPYTPDLLPHVLTFAFDGTTGKVFVDDVFIGSFGLGGLNPTLTHAGFFIQTDGTAQDIVLGPLEIFAT